MGQACCVPHKYMSRRTAKLKAEAHSAAVLSGDLAQDTSPSSSGFPPMGETHSNLLHSGRITELREIHAGNSSAVRGLREPREWLQQKKHRLTGHKNKKAQLPEKFTSSRDKHKHNQENKVKVARNEASFADNNEPITLLEATLLEEIPLREAAGQIVQSATPPGAAHSTHLRELLHEQSTIVERQRNPQPETANNYGQPPRELLSPIPRRPANPLQFPFINHMSDTLTCSSERSSKGSNDERESSEKNSTSSGDTIVARRVTLDRADAGSVRFSISSGSPDVFYMAPTSPNFEPAVPTVAPTLVLTPASPPALPVQPPSMPSGSSNPNLLDVKVPASSTQL